jgi:hypothetical protein
MAQRVVQTNKRLAAERQIHAAIAHFHAGDFECAITLCGAAENRMPEPSEAIHLFRILQLAGDERPAPDGQKDDFNYAANWMKHDKDPDEVEIDELEVKLWLYRAISKYRAVYGIGTPEMADLFPWASSSSRPSKPA